MDPEGQDVPRRGRGELRDKPLAGREPGTHPEGQDVPDRGEEGNIG